MTEKSSVFVVHEHQAHTYHHDFRLEKDGVLKSWAVPKGIPTEKGIKHLALETEDHALEYADYEGEIEEGQYGAGIVKIWDKGTYEIREWIQDRIVVDVDGDHLKGRYCLVRFKRGGERGWLIFQAS